MHTTTLATRVAFDWKPWTMVLNWRGLVLFALSESFCGRATVDELYEVIGTHPLAAGEPGWKQQILEALESNPDEFVLNEHGRWSFVDENHAREAVQFFSVDGPARWQGRVPPELRRTIEALWPSTSAK